MFSYLLLELKEHMEKINFHIRVQTLESQLASLYPALLLHCLSMKSPRQVLFAPYIANLSRSHLLVNSYSPIDSFPSVNMCISLLF